MLERLVQSWRGIAPRERRLVLIAGGVVVLALIYLSAQETRLYSATHAMLVSCVCMLTAREVLGWAPVHSLADICADAEVTDSTLRVTSYDASDT